MLQKKRFLYKSVLCESFATSDICTPPEITPGQKTPGDSKRLIVAKSRSSLTKEMGRSIVPILFSSFEISHESKFFANCKFGRVWKKLLLSSVVVLSRRGVLNFYSFPSGEEGPGEYAFSSLL